MPRQVSTDETEDAYQRGRRTGFSIATSRLAVLDRAIQSMGAENDPYAIVARAKTYLAFIAEESEDG